jgi:hypothetical protein
LHYFIEIAIEFNNFYKDNFKKMDEFISESLFSTDIYELLQYYKKFINFVKKKFVNIPFLKLIFIFFEIIILIYLFKTFYY